MHLYRQTRQEATRLLQEIAAAGFTRVLIHGDPGNDLLDVLKLTSLEHDLAAIESSSRRDSEYLPVLEVEGRELRLKLPASAEPENESLTAKSSKESARRDA